MTIDNEIINLRRHFHSYPELSNEEFKTADFIETYLKSLKIPTKRLAKTGVIGLLKGSKAGKTIALRADIDALRLYKRKIMPLINQKMQALCTLAGMTLI